MKFFLHAFLFIIISINILFADNVKWERALSIGSSSLNSSSIFDVISNTKGSKPAPAMTTTQRDAIASPQQGLMIFNTTTKELNLYNNSTWTVVANTSQSQTLTDKIIVGTANSISGLRHGTEVDSPSSGVHGVTGNLVGTTDAQNLSNKSFADAPSFLEIVTPGSPASGYIKLYAKSDERFYKLSPSGIEKSLTPVFTPSAGALFYSDGTNDLFSLTSVGTPGQYLQSNGSSVPTWVNPSSSGVVFTPSAGNVMFSSGTPNVISLTNTGTPGQYLQSNGSGTPSWSTVSSGSQVTFTPSAGQVAFSDGTPNALKMTTSGTSGYFLKTNGSGTPSWDTPARATTFQAFTSGSGTYTTPANVYRIVVRMVGGGGGGGGGGNASAGFGAGGGGGGGGGYSESTINNPSASYSYSVGSGGSGGGIGSNGSGGNNTTFSTYTSSGGNAGTGGSTVLTYGSGGGGGSGSGGSINSYGNAGSLGGVGQAGAAQGIGGDGGGSFFGGGGQPGSAGQNFGGGGGGGGGAASGGAGGSGYIHIEEFYNK